MSTPPSSIEEVAKRVKELKRLDDAQGFARSARYEAEMGTLAPQLAEWVEKALPVIEAARDVCLQTSVKEVWDELNPTRDGYQKGIVVGSLMAAERLEDALTALDTSSSLAAEGTTE